MTKGFLPQYYRAARLRVQEMSYRQIAAEMGISTNMVGQLLTQARAAGLTLPAKRSRLGVPAARLPLVHSTSGFDAESWWAERGYQ